MIKKVISVILGIILFGIIGILITQASTTIHEEIHVIVAKLFGADAGINKIDVYTGSSSYEFVKDVSKSYDILIAMAPSLILFFVAWYIWESFGENSIMRAVALVMWLYSVFPSSFPILPGSDFYYAIQVGANPIFMWIIWIFISGVVWYNIIEEIEDRKIF